MTPYRAPAWLPGGHAQTIYPALRPLPAIAYRRERWDTPDGDFIDVDWAGAADAPRRMLLFHGLEGSSGSHYARAIVGRALAAGWQCCVPHFRGCSGEINRLPRAYHSGDSEEADWILRAVHARMPASPVHIAGVSLGGNVLLKWLGERANDALPLVARAAAISAPLDLAAAGHALGHGFNRVYTRMFLASLKRKAAAKLSRYPGLFDARRMHASRTLYEFDDVVTAPLHGFRDTDDYWARASCWPLLGAIRVPTLVLNAMNDPFLPAEALAVTRGASASVKLEFPRHGGHVGFPSARPVRDAHLPSDAGDARTPAGSHGWLAERILAFFNVA